MEDDSIFDLNDEYDDEHDEDFAEGEYVGTPDTVGIDQDPNSSLLSDPFLMAVALGLGEEIGDIEAQRLRDGEPPVRVSKDIERVSIKRKETKPGSFFDYVLNRCKK